MPPRDYGTTFDRNYLAIVTPYKAGSFVIDEAELRNMLRYFAGSPRFKATGGLIINAAAGELFSLTREEKRRNVQIAVEEFKGKMPVFAGAAGATTQEAIDIALDAKKLGVDGLFMHPPIGSADISGGWNATLYPEVLLDYSKAIDDAADLPIIYSPSGGGGWKHGNFPPNVVVEMVKEIPNIIGWKMTYSSDGYKVIARTLRSVGRHIAIMPAGGETFHGALLEDMMDGSLSGCWNYAMEPMLDHIEAWRKGNLEQAKKIWNSGLGELQTYTGEDHNRHHLRFKAAAWLRGLISNPLMRPPYPKPRKEEVLKIRSLLQKAGINVIDQSQMESTFRMYVYSPKETLSPTISR